MGVFKATLSALCVAMLVAACGSTTEGQATSPLYDPFKAGGLPAQDGPSGIREDAPEPTGTVEDTNDSDQDKLALLSVNDIEEYWNKNYGEFFDGSFKPVGTLVSYDSDDPAAPTLCGDSTYKSANAFYCPPKDMMAWDRGVLIPLGQKFFGDVSIAGVIGHEYGHAVQAMADLVDKSTPGLVFEQQADCFAGNYIRWVAEGQSPRFELSTGDGLNHLLAGLLTLRDPTYGPEESSQTEEGHGTALDRISAFQMGFVGNASDCAKIDAQEISERRGDLPLTLPVDQNGDVSTGNVAITEDVVKQFVDTLGKVFQPSTAPTLSFDAATCADAKPSPSASYCPASNTIFVDVAALAEMGKPADLNDYTLLQGDNTALSVVASRYALAIQKEHGDSLDSATSALRTACLTGVSQSAMATDTSGDLELTLTADDLDEAVAGLLTNGLAASNVNGETVPAGFTRIIAYRSGLKGDRDLCYQRFK